MRKILYIVPPVAAIAFICLLYACKKDYPSKVVVISYPVVTLNGPVDTTINRGATWVDPGAAWKDTVTGESGTIKATINTTSDSAYFLLYIATNKNGFQSINNPNNLVPVWRGVAVTNMSNNIDITGSYTVTGYLGPMSDTLYKVSRALFYTPDIDGFLDPGLIAIKSDSTISVATIIPAITEPQPPNNLFGTYVTSAAVPLTFSSAQIWYTPKDSLQYNATVLNGPPIPVTFVHN